MCEFNHREGLSFVSYNFNLTYQFNAFYDMTKVFDYSNADQTTRGCQIDFDWAASLFLQERSKENDQQ